MKYSERNATMDKPDYLTQPDTIALPTQPPKSTLQIGDAVLTFIGDTTNLDQTVNSLIGKLERAVAAFKAEWNR